MAVRLGFLALFLLGGFLYWPIFLLAALSAWALVSDLSGSRKPEPDEWFARRWTITAADPRWRSDFLQFCQSPAETAFLEAMIAAYDLKPQKGILQGSGLTLDLQVKMSSYRADFVACGWLVIEIDGAAYHSSDEAVARDRKRDEFMEGLGYRVLRLPAKLVFRSPKDAVSRVRAALAAGRSRVQPQVPSQVERTSRPSLATGAMFTGEINAGVERVKAVRQAMADAEMTFHREKLVIDSAINSARRKLEIDNYVGNDKDKRDAYDRHHAELSKLFEQHDRKLQDRSSGQRRAPPVIIPAMAAPKRHETDAINEAVENAYRRLTAERSRYLSEQRARLHGDPRLRASVRANLTELGCSEVYALVAPPN